MKIIVPMAGRGSRFLSRGTPLLKPLIEVCSRPMMAWALESLRDVPYTEIIFVVLKEHEVQYAISGVINKILKDHVKIITIDEPTEGQLCTVLAARDHIDPNEDLLIASSDTYVISKIKEDIEKRSADCRGIISVCNMPGDRWSFAKTDESGRVVEVAEKVRISDYASTGIYYFSKSKEFIEAADELIRNQEKVRGEYYVIPVYQKYIRFGWRVNIASAEEMWDMGTPEAIEAFKNHLSAASMDSQPGSRI